MDKTTHRIISAIREELLVLAEAGMRFPKADSFEHGVQVGNWQGLEKAHQIIESVLHDDEEEARR